MSRPTLMLLRVLALTLLLAGPALAQEDQERTIYDIQLKDDPRITTGKSAFLEGTTNPYGVQFQLTQTQLDQPISIGLYTTDAAHPVGLRVGKDSLSAPVREVLTDANGRAELHFRTYDGFKLWVSAQDTADYQLVVWVGDEVPTIVPPAAVAASKYVAPAGQKNAGEGISSGLGALAWTTIGLALALVVLLMMIGVYFLARRSVAGEKK